VKSALNVGETYGDRLNTLLLVEVLQIILSKFPFRGSLKNPLFSFKVKLLKLVVRNL
jgi:hypothetical protein